MAIVCEQAKVVYIAVPKVACTSLKVFFYEINNRVNWPSHRLSHALVHGYPGYATPDYKAERLQNFTDYSKVAVIRDPVERVISAYKDKARPVVLEGKGLKKPLAEAGLPTDPDPTTFCKNIQQYSDICPVIHSHIKPYRCFLGSDISAFERLFKIEEISEMAEMMSAKLDRKVSVKKTNESRSIEKTKSVAFSDENRKCLRDFCEKDYQFLSEYY